LEHTAAAAQTLLDGLLLEKKTHDSLDKTDIPCEPLDDRYEIYDLHEEKEWVEEVQMLSDNIKEPLLDLDKCSLNELINILQGFANDPSFFANRTLELKETMDSTKHPKKNENYNEILEKPFISNLQTVSMACRHCRSSLSSPDIVGCEQEVAERVKKTTSAPETKKKGELPIKLLDDSKIPIAR
jgi:hypothetical protein